MTTTNPPKGQTTRRYLVVSADSHVGPSLENDIGQYCPQKYRPAFEDHLHQIELMKKGEIEFSKLSADDQRLRAVKSGFGPRDPDDHPRQLARKATAAAKGQRDPIGRLEDMDAGGIACDVIFAGGQNGEALPFLGDGGGAGSDDIPGELRAVGARMWNEWLADFVKVEPHRHVGVMQVPIFDIDAATCEVEWAVNAGLKAVNLAAPRPDFPAFNELMYEPFWSVCEEAGVPLVTHAGAGGGQPLGITGLGGAGCYSIEALWFAHRGLWQLICGGVFERHPNLKIVFTETFVDWVPPVLRELDSAYHGKIYDDLRLQLKRLPSEYWATNCFLSGSFLAPFEVELRDEVGLKNLMWGEDYPHIEGCWPHTKLAMRNTFSGVPEKDVRQILGENALSVYPLDEAALRPVADRIGPMPEEIDLPLKPEEFPTVGSFRAFRERGSFS